MGGLVPYSLPLYSCVGVYVEGLARDGAFGLSSGRKRIEIKAFADVFTKAALSPQLLKTVLVKLELNQRPLAL